jgi:hypothetical protein
MAKSTVVTVTSASPVKLAAAVLVPITCMVCTCGQPGQLLLGGADVNQANGYTLFPGAQTQYTLVAGEALYGIAVDVSMSVHVLAWGSV